MKTVDELNAGFQNARTLWTAIEDANLDIGLAERAGDQAQIEAAKKLKAQASTAWHKQHLENEADARVWLESIGLDIRGLKTAIS